LAAHDHQAHHPSAKAIAPVGEHMTDQLLDDFRRISESMLMMQQDVFRQWQRVLLSATPGIRESGEWEKNMQKRWRELAVETLNKHRQMVDSTYKSSNELFEQALHVADAKSPDEYRQIVDNLWSQAFVSIKERSESQLRDFYNMAAMAFELSRKAPAA
jgi:hypothetical protein